MLDHVATERHEIGDRQGGATRSPLRPGPHEASQRIPMILDPQCPPPEIAMQYGQVCLRIALRHNAEFRLGPGSIQRHLSPVQPISNQWLGHACWEAASCQAAPEIPVGQRNSALP